LTKGLVNEFCHFSWLFYLKKYEVKTMELAEKQVSASTRLWISRAQRKHPRKIDYDSELRSWLQHAILEAEKNKNFNKKNQLLILLSDL
jgi:hypothetical protein